MGASFGSRVIVRERSTLALDADANGSGPSAAQSLSCRLREQGRNVRTVRLPVGHHPNSFFVQGGDGDQFQALLEARSIMRLHVVYLEGSTNGHSPVRVVEPPTGREVGWINRYLDRKYVRRPSG
jgi:hypothetical protein